MIVLLRGGTIALHEGGKATGRLYVSGGFAEITPDRCTVLADEAVPVAEVSRATARSGWPRPRRRWRGDKIDMAARGCGDQPRSSRPAR